MHKLNKPKAQNDRARKNPEQTPQGVFHPSVKSREVFDSAIRHSGRVRILKIALPIAAIAIALVFCWYTFWATSTRSDILIIQGDQTEDGKLTMTAPRLEGYNDANRPYLLNAARAIQDPTQNGLIELQDIKAQLPVGDEDQADVVARSAVYDNINGRLNFNQPFQIKTTSGIEADLSSANINLSTGQLTTTDPVDIKRNNERLKANALRVDNNGEVLYFYNGVKLVIDNMKP